MKNNAELSADGASKEALMRSSPVAGFVKPNGPSGGSTDGATSATAPSPAHPRGDPDESAMADVASSETSGAPTLLEPLLREERHAALVCAVSSICHALGTPLNVIAGRASLVRLALEQGDPDVTKHARIIEEQVAGVSRLLWAMRDFTDSSVVEAEQQELGCVLGMAVELVEPVARHRDVTVRADIDGPPFPTSVPAAPLLQLLVHLLFGGVRLAPPSGAVTIRIRRALLRPPESERGLAHEGPGLQIEVTWPGFCLDGRSPYQRLEPWLQGFEGDADECLRLSIVHGVVTRHRGWIDTRQTPDGTAFILHWPLPEGPLTRVK